MTTPTGWWSLNEVTYIPIINSQPGGIMGTNFVNRRAYAVARGPLGRFAPVSELGETAVPAYLPPVFTSDDGTFRRPEGLRERAISLLSKRR